MADFAREADGGAVGGAGEQNELQGNREQEGRCHQLHNYILKKTP